MLLGVVLAMVVTAGAMSRMGGVVSEIHMGTGATVARERDLGRTSGRLPSLAIRHTMIEMVTEVRRGARARPPLDAR